MLRASYQANTYDRLGPPGVSRARYVDSAIAHVGRGIIHIALLLSYCDGHGTLLRFVDSIQALDFAAPSLAGMADEYEVSSDETRRLLSLEQHYASVRGELRQVVVSVVCRAFIYLIVASKPVSKFSLCDKYVYRIIV